MGTWNIAHRGGAALRPENTLAAFSHAVALGADGAELDVQLSADGVAVVHHDFRLNPGYARLDGAWLDAPGPRLKDLTLEQLRRYDLGRVRPGSDYAAAHPLQQAAEGARVPALREVIAVAKAAPAFRLLIELKSDRSEDSADPLALADAALAAVEAADFLSGAIFVGFDWRALAQVKQRQPDAVIWCSTDRDVEGAAALFEVIRRMDGAGWFPHFSQMTQAAAALAGSYGLALGAWTVNEESEMQRLLALGLDAICTDRPDLLASLRPPAG